MTIEMTKNELNQLRTACTSVILGFMAEIRDPEISAERKAVAERSLEMWQSLKMKLMEEQK